jgi:hypothetical protein
MEKDAKDRLRQITLATFDNYVIKRMLETSYIICDGGSLDERELGCLAANVGCDANTLHSVISMACGRISKQEVCLKISQEDECEAINKVIRFRIKQSIVPLANYRRELGKEVKELNHNHFNLNITLDELMLFIKPFFEEVLDEIFEKKQPR